MKLGTTRTITSFQPDTRNGHKPSITVQFWGDKSLSMRGSTQGPGRKPKQPDIETIKPWWQNQIQVDEATLKPVVAKVKKKEYVKPDKPKITLDQLITQLTRRTR